MGPKAREAELPEPLYYMVCIAYLLGVCLASIVVEDLTLIFGIIAGIAECTTVFILPSLFYLQACKMESRRQLPHQTSAREPLLAGGKSQIEDKVRRGSIGTQLLVVLFMLTGVGYFTLSNIFFFRKVHRMT